MNALEIQIVLFWGAVTAYIAATCLDLVAVVFKKAKLIQIGHKITLIGFIPHTAGIILRWVETGHFPYWGRYEVLNSYSWALVALYVIGAQWKPNLRVVGTGCFPVAFFMTGMALTGSTEVKSVPSSFMTYWLGVHIAFAKLAYGSGLFSAVFGALYLRKRRKVQIDRNNTSSGTGMALETMDYYCYRFAVFAFITLSVMIAAGAVWANKAWGRYWGWDPVETWSLVSWFVYALILHLRSTMGWRGRRAAWLSVIALVVIILAFFGMPLLYDTYHEHLQEMAK